MLRKPAPVPKQIDPPLPRAWEITMALLTLVSVALVLAEWGLEEEMRDMRSQLAWLDIGFCTVFLAEYGVRFVRSESRLRFFRSSWLELLGAIPLIGPLRTLRVIRLVRVLRILRMGRALSTFDVTVPREIGSVALAFVVIWAVTASMFYFFEAGHNSQLHGFEDALWWSITTLSTVGYGDTYPATHAGRLVAVLTMVMGVGVLGTLAATLATALLEVRERGRKGLRSWRMQEHLVVLGWNTRSPAAIKDFRLDPRYREMPIVIVAELDASPMDDPEVRFVRGNPARREVLERASAGAAAAAMVFARDPSDPRSDHQTALVVLTLRRLSASVKIGAELVDSENHEHLAEIGCDAVIDVGALGAMLLVRGIQDVGVTEVVEDLLSNAEGSELYRVRVPEDFVGRTYGELAVALVERDVALIGLERNDKRVLNADRETSLLDSDHLFVVAREPP